MVPRNRTWKLGLARRPQQEEIRLPATNSSWRATLNAAKSLGISARQLLSDQQQRNLDSFLRTHKMLGKTEDELRALKTVYQEGIGAAKNTAAELNPFGALRNSPPPHPPLEGGRRITRRKRRQTYKRR